MKAPSCCWVPVCPVMDVCQRRRAWRSHSKAWRKWSGFWHSTRFPCSTKLPLKPEKVRGDVSWHLPYLTSSHVVSLSLSEVRRVEAQGAGGIDLSTVSAFLRCQVRCGHHWGRPQALWLPQEFRWASETPTLLLSCCNAKDLIKSLHNIEMLFHVVIRSLFFSLRNARLTVHLHIN